jgi:feruloyl esterase
MFALLTIAGQASALTCDSASISTIAPLGSVITSAQTVSGGSGSYCQVTAAINSSNSNATINYEISLPPPSVWNARLAFIGNAIFGGQLPPVSWADYTRALQNFYAVVGTDTGHQTNAKVDASWALGNSAAIADFDYLAVHEVKVAAQALISSYYGNSPVYSYFDGCSTGGRQGIVEAEVYPDDFDGIIAGDPAIGDPFIGFNWNEQANLAPGGQLTVAAINLLNQAVINQCGDPNGPAQGLIINPPACNFNLNPLQCNARQSPPACLTAAQIATIDAIYDGAPDVNGEPLYPGYSVSDPADGGLGDGGWGAIIAGCTTTSCAQPQINTAEPWGIGPNGIPSGPEQWVVQDEYLKYMAFANPSFDTLTLSFSNLSEINQITAAAETGGADGMDFSGLSNFAALNHKLLMYHGWSDPTLSPYISQEFFSGAQNVLGGSMSNNVRLFMVPGMHHCGGGPGPNSFDMLTPLTQWVEQGVEPDKVVALHYENNDPSQPIDRSMPLCSWPELPTYNGTGSYALASSWSCVIPARVAAE